MIKLDTILVKNEDIAWRKIDDDAILIDMDEEEVTHFNEVAAQIWDSLDGTKSTAEIIEHIRSQFEVDQEQAKKDVFAFLNKLLQKEMVEIKQD
jgi:2-polyprenyl-3-methyl-5-hydroxy-6-metoxy-1,4-benzoquinol methylase